MRALILVSLLAAGCGHLLPGGVRCPSSGGAAWRELRSQHFLLDTDLPDPAAADWIRDLEQLEATVAGALSNKPVELPGRLRVVVAQTLDTYLEIAPGRALGYFTADNYFHEPTIVLHPDAEKQDPETISHELGHFVSYHLFPRHPHWFEEGVVQFAQTVANPNPRYHNLAGLMPSMRIREVNEGAVGGRPVDIPSLFAWKGTGAGELSLWSWGLFHWLWNNRPDQLDDYQRRLLAKVPPEEAWNLAFPEFDMRLKGSADKLGGLVRDHLREAKFDAYYEVKATSNPAFTQRPLSAAQVHVLLLDVRRKWLRPGIRTLGFEEDKVNVTNEQLAFALQDDPDEPVAGFKDRFTKKQPQLAGARAAAAAHPDDWRAFSVLAIAEEPGSKEQEAALRKAVALEPDSPFANDRLATFLRDRPQEALPFARRAVQLAPDDPFNLETLTGVVAALKDCDQVRELYERASDQMPTYGSQELKDRLQQDRALCPK